MNSKQRRVLQTIFENPIQPGIKWSDIESLLVALGAKLEKKGGSRLRVSLNDAHAGFHRPHPENTAGKGRVRDVRAFLENAGVTPDEV